MDMFYIVYPSNFLKLDDFTLANCFWKVAFVTIVSAKTIYTTVQKFRGLI